MLFGKHRLRNSRGYGDLAGNGMRQLSDQSNNKLVRKRTNKHPQMFSRGRFDEKNVCVLGVGIDGERRGTPHTEAIPPFERDLIDQNLTVDDKRVPPWVLELGLYVQVMPRSADSLDIFMSCETRTAPSASPTKVTSRLDVCAASNRPRA